MPTKKKSVTTESPATTVKAEVKKPRARAASAVAATHKPAVRRTAKKAAPAQPEAGLIHAEVEREAYLLWERTGGDAISNWLAAEKTVSARYSA